MTYTKSDEVLKDLQGLRGVAVLLVVLYHAAVPGLSGGYVGVDIFFVISGYLITGLLVRERQQTGTISFAQFYARRARRLLPAAGVTIVATLICSWLLFAPIEQRRNASSAFAAVLYFSNIWFAVAANDYFAGDSERDLFLHTWSLAVEEQFYFVWPALIFLATRGVARDHIQARLVAVLTITSIASFAMCAYLTSTNQPWAFYSMPTRMWEFGLGAIGMLLLPRGSRLSPRLSAGMSAMGVVLIAWASTQFDGDSVFPGFAAIIPALGACLLLGAGRASMIGPVTKLLSTLPMRWLGDVSYSWYLWHWPALVITKEFIAHDPWAIALAVLGSLLVAAVSYQLIENPIRRSPALAVRVRASLAGGAVAGLAGAAVAFLAHDIAKTAMARPPQLTYSDARDDRPGTGTCHASIGQIEMPDCVFGNVKSPRTIALFGDSHAHHWFPAVEYVASHVDARLVSLTKSACTPVDVSIYSEGRQRQYYECDAWREAMLLRMAAMRPALVIMSSTWYEGVDATGRPAPLPPAEWKRGVDTVIARLNASDIAVLMIHDTPFPNTKVPDCLARTAWRGKSGPDACAFTLARSEGVRANTMAVNQSIASQIDALSVDFTDVICPRATCATERDGYVLFSDDSHLTARFSRSLGDPLLHHLMDYAKRRPDSRVSELFVETVAVRPDTTTSPTRRPGS